MASCNSLQCSSFVVAFCLPRPVPLTQTPSLSLLRPGCGCAMLFGLRSKLTSVLFVRFPFALLVVRLPFFGGYPCPEPTSMPLASVTALPS